MSSNVFDEAFMKKLQNLSLHFSAPVNNVYTGARRAAAHGSTVEFSNFREYIQGDDFRRIDWNAYARFEKFFIKLFLDEKQLRVRIFADTSASMDFGTPTKFSSALRLSAAFAFLAFRGGDSTEIFGLHDRRCESLCGAISTTGSFFKALETLEGLTPAGETGLEQALKDCRDMRTGDGIAVLLSDLMSENDYAAAVDYLLYHKQKVILVHILSPEEKEPELNGALRLLDSENGSFCEINAGPETLACYKRALGEYLDGIRSYCMKRGVAYLPVTTDENLENVLLDRGFRMGILQ